MKCYMIKHKPTGMFYSLARCINSRVERGRTKSNLAEKVGKIYHLKPSINNYSGWWYSHLSLGNRPDLHVANDDLEIVELN